MNKLTLLIAIMFVFCAYGQEDMREYVQYDYSNLADQQISYFEWSGLPIIVVKYNETEVLLDDGKTVNLNLDKFKDNFSHQFVSALSSFHDSLQNTKYRNKMSGLFVALAIDTETGCKIIYHQQKLIDPCSLEEYDITGKGVKKALAIPPYFIKDTIINVPLISRKNNLN